MGFFLLSKGLLVKVGLLGTMVFVIMLMPINIGQLAWAVVVIANLYLLTKSFDISLAEMVSKHFLKKK